MIFVDSNIVIDLTAPDRPFYRWSRTRLDALVAGSRAVLNAVVLAEVAVRMSDFAQFQLVIRNFELDLIAIDAAAAFRAGSAFQEYRFRGGPRTSMIPDFLIGAHAATLGIPLLTRDPRRFSSYFPDLALISPESQPV